MQVAWLKKWSYTHEVYKKIWSPWKYYPKESNIDTIETVRDWWVWIIPIMNTYWWTVRKEIWKIIQLKSLSHIKWIYDLPVNHVLAWSGKVWDLTEVHAHPQALMQCSSWLIDIWASTQELVASYNHIKEIPNTTQCNIEIDDWIWVLEKITKIFEHTKINIRHIHSFPIWKWKYRFYTVIDNSNTNLLYLNKELGKIWWEIIKSNEEINNWKIKLVSRDTNVDWIPDALDNSNIWVICSEQTAFDNWLNILNPNFSPEDNQTSFIVLANNQTNISLNNFKWIVQNKVLWLLTLPNRVWILRQALSTIKNVWLSLSFILSLNDGDWWARIAVVMDKWISWEIMSIQRELNKIGWNLKIM
jgi:prephenate dehydratase